MSTTTEEPPREQSGPHAEAAPRRDAGEVLVFLAGPLAHLTNLGLNELLVGHAMRAQHRLELHAVTLVTFAIALAGTLASWRLLRRHGERASVDEDAGGPRAMRERFLAMGGVGLGALACALILGNEIPNLLLWPGN